jgi:hypothetical protein
MRFVDVSLSIVFLPASAAHDNNI